MPNIYIEAQDKFEEFLVIFTGETSPIYGYWTYTPDVVEDKVRHFTYPSEQKALDSITDLNNFSQPMRLVHTGPLEDFRTSHPEYFI